MEESRGGLYFLEDLVGGQDAYSANGFSPLSRVAVQGYLTNEQCHDFQEPALAPYEPQAPADQACPAPSGEFGTTFKVNFRLPEKELNGGCLEHDPLRQATLQSVESTLSTFDFPNTPSKLYTEPARLQEPSPFNISSLDFLDDPGSGLPSSTRVNRLKLSTAPPDVLLGSKAADFSARSSFTANQELSTDAVPRSSAPMIPGDRSSASGTPPYNQPCGATQSEGDLRLGLGEARGGSLPSSQGQQLATRNSSICSQQVQDDWNGSEVAKSFEKVGINPRKTEQNRRAQARFRQRKKDMFFDQKRQIQTLTTRLEQAMKERKSYEEKSCHLQQLVDVREKRIETLELHKKDSQCVEEMSCACWDFVLELRRGRRSLGYSREAVVEMVNAMLMRGSPALGFIRKEMVDQLNECLKLNRDRVDLPSHLWMNDLINAYERMVERCGECHPQALRTFLSLQLPEHRGQPADAAFWRRVLEAGGMRPDQLSQLASSHNGLVSKMQQLVARRKELAQLVQTGGQESAKNQQPLLSNMAQSQFVLDLHMQILKEERAAVFNFLGMVRLVLEPMQKARLIVTAYPFALDNLAICSLVSESSQSLGMLNNSLALLSQLPQDSPFQTLTPSQPHLPNQIQAPLSLH